MFSTFMLQNILTTILNILRKNKFENMFVKHVLVAAYF